MKYVKIIDKNNHDESIRLIKKSFPIIILRQFADKTECKNIINLSHNLAKKLPNRKKINNNMLSFDVLPMNVKTNRIFRTIYFNKQIIKKRIFQKLKMFQEKHVIKKYKNIIRKFRSIHYHRGGGFFDWHKHPRYPNNYGIILNLSSYKKDFKKGSNLFKINKKIINIENLNLSAGDLILFRYNIPHCVTPVDPENNLTFDKKGRWTIILPIAY